MTKPLLRIAEGWCPLPDHPRLVVDVDVSMQARFPSGTSSCVRSRCDRCDGWWTWERTDVGDVFCFLGRVRNRTGDDVFVQQVAHVTELTWKPDVLVVTVANVLAKLVRIAYDVGADELTAKEVRP